MFEIDFYEDANGFSELEQYIQGLSRSHQTGDKAILRKLTVQLRVLELRGPLIREPQAKFFHGYRHPLAELRPQPERIFFARWQRDRFVLLNHYTKRQNRTDPRQIERALFLLDDWLLRKRGNI